MFGEARLPLKTRLPYYKKVRQCCGVQWALFKLANKLISMVSIKRNTGTHIVYCTLYVARLLHVHTVTKDAKKQLAKFGCIVNQTKAQT